MKLASLFLLLLSTLQAQNTAQKPRSTLRIANVDVYIGQKQSEIFSQLGDGYKVEKAPGPLYEVRAAGRSGELLGTLMFTAGGTLFSASKPWSQPIQPVEVHESAEQLYRLLSTIIGAEGSTNAVIQLSRMEDRDISARLVYLHFQDRTVAITSGESISKGKRYTHVRLTEEISMGRQQ